MGPGRHRSAHRPQRVVAIDLLAALADALPELDQPVDDRRVRLSGDQRAVERTDAGAEHEVRGEVALEECLEHADLDGAEHATATEDERGRHVVDGSSSSAFSVVTFWVTTRSTQKISSGMRPAASTTAVKVHDQSARRESRKATTT